LSAAMSSTSGEVNALASTAVIDFYRRLSPTKRTDKQEVSASKWFTFLWGGVAIACALSASLFENLIQLVNIIGSLFYGTILGVFLCGFFLKRLKGTEVFFAAVIIESAVILIYLRYDLSFLWLNPIGCFGVILFAWLFHLLKPRKT